MRALRIAALLLAALLPIGYALALGIYAVASTRPAVPSQPATAAEAREIIERLGLASEYPFEPHFVRTPHGRMHYVEAGSGPSLLCLHGNPTWSFLYRHFLRGLSDRARVIAPDLIGFGLSEKPADPASYSIEGHVDDVVSLIDALDLRALTLVMQDWGGPIGLGAALQRPDRIRALVVMNTIGFVPRRLRNGGGPPLPLRILRVPGLGEGLVQGLGLFHRAFVPAGIERPERRSERVLHAYLDVQGSWDARAGTLAFPRAIPRHPDDAVARLLAREDAYLQRFDGPVLIAWGLQDPVFARELLEEWRERFPRAPVLELPRAGHYLQEDAWEEIVPRIAQLLGAPANAAQP